MDCSIIIVSYNTIDDTRQCLKSLEQAGNEGLSFEVVIVDNASKDGTNDMVRGEFPSVILIENSDNKGFAGGNNQGLAIAKGDFVLFLNPDTIMLPNSLAAMLDFMRKNNDIGCLGPHTFNGDKVTTQKTAQHELGVMPFFHLNVPLYKVIPGYSPKTADLFAPTTTMEVDVVQGSCMLLPRALALEVGGMNSRFFMYSEEHDLCQKVREAGYKVVYFKEADIVHWGGTSTSQVSEKMLRKWAESLLLYIQAKDGNLASKMLFFLLLIGSVWRLPVWAGAALVPSLRSRALKRLIEHKTLLRYYIETFSRFGLTK